MKNATNRIQWILLLVFAGVLVLKGQTINRQDTAIIYLTKPLLKVQTPAKIENIRPVIRDQYQTIGCICDPFVARQLFISAIGGVNSPYFGIGVSRHLKNYRGLEPNLVLRTDFGHDYIVNAGVETSSLFFRCPIDFRLEYNRYHVAEKGLANYNSYLCGVIYRRAFASFGLYTGVDNYAGSHNAVVRLNVGYALHVANGDCCKTTRTIAKFSGDIGIWRNTINYKVNIDVPFCYWFSIGAGYEKLYNYNDCIFTLKYMIHR